MDEKKIIIIAGPNGAGKTTFAREFLPNEAHCRPFISADLIAAGLSPFVPELAAIKAAKIMLGNIDELVAQGRSFALAGVGLSHKGKNDGSTQKISGANRPPAADYCAG